VPSTSSKPPKKAPRATKPWVSLTLDQARRELSTTVHFYSKCTNTNAAPAGVRLPADEQPMPWPVVGFSTTALDRRHTTYTVGAPLIGPFGQIMAVLEGVEDESYKDIPAGQREICLEATAVLNTSFELRTLDPRLRQVLMPAGCTDVNEGEPGQTGSVNVAAADNYVALTPLHSDKFSQVLDQRRRAEGEAGFQWRSTMNIDLGGSKKQNMARRARFMCTVLNFPAPQENAELRQAMAIFHKGPRLADLLPRGLLMDFAAQLLALPDPTARAGVAWRGYLEATVRQAAAHVLSAADALAQRQRRVLADIEGLDDAGASAKAVDGFLRALLDPTLRDKPWKRAFAQRLISEIESFKVNAEGALLTESGTFGHLIQFVEMEVL